MVKCYEGPITGNTKCIVISIFCALFYWYMPPKNKWVLVGILYFTYLAIAWYDEYLCSRTLTPSYLRQNFKNFYLIWYKPWHGKNLTFYFQK